MVIKVICQSCGAVAQKQSNEMMNGSEDMYSCPTCKQAWQPLGDLFEEEEVEVKK